MDRLLDLASKVTEGAEVFVVETEDTPVSFEANRLKLLESRQSLGVGLRIIKEGRLGISSATSLEHPEALVEAALEVSQFGAVARFELPPLAPYPQVAVYDPTIESLEVTEMVEMGQSLIDKVRAFDSRVLCEAWVTKMVARVHILNSRGGRAGYRKSIFGLGLEGQLIQDTDILFVGENDSSCHPKAQLEMITRSVTRQLELGREIAPAPKGECPVLFTPHGVRSAFIAPLAMAFNGKLVLQGASPLRGRQGEQIFDRGLELWDDATLPFGVGSRICDDEGVPSQRTPLIVRGVVGEFLYDLQTAALSGKRSTGNGSRSPASLPSPAVSALIFGEGEASFEEMVAQIRDGLIVERLMGAGQGNILGGEFSGNVLLGYRVERGQIVGRVKDTMVSGNVYEALKDGLVIGREGRWVGGTLYTPPILCPGLSVASKE